MKKKIKIGQCKACLGPAFDADRPVESWKGFRCTFQLLDGSYMDLTICDTCFENELDLDALWLNILEGWKEELEEAAEVPDPNLAHRRAQFLAKQAGGNLILAHLCGCSWKDALCDEELIMIGWE